MIPSQSRCTATSRVRIAVVLGDLLGTYGDTGNAEVLARRLSWRGIGCEVLAVDGATPVPESADIYLLGGGEDINQVRAAEWLRAHPGLQRAAGRGVPVLAVCAGLQILGRTFAGPNTITHTGLGLLDVETFRLPHRAIGEVIATPDPALDIDTLTGFENHRYGTRLGFAARPLATVVRGTGNGIDAAEGVIQGSVIGTYLHGPVLARNPGLADRLLGLAMARPLAPLPLAEVADLRRERMSDARHRSRIERRYAR
jgi:CobQ-like glutamine amidotransferase family enzyme